MRYTIEVSEAELDVVRLALGRKLDPKPVRVKRSPAPPPVAQPIEVADPALAAFMQRRRDAGAPAVPPVIKPSAGNWARLYGGPPTPMGLSDEARARLEHEWMVEVRRAIDEPGRWLTRLANAANRPGLAMSGWGIER